MPKGVFELIPVGATFSRWTVTGPPFRRRDLLYPCRCDCGTKRHVRAGQLRNGESSSCGCFHREMMTRRGTTHGGSTTPEYRAWGAMKERCYVPEHKEFKNYGARGITVCDEWRDSFAAFLRDVGYKPTATHSLDRIDNNGHYERGNVRWATKVDQSLNRRPVRRYRHDGQTLTIREWAERTGLKHATLRMRIVRLGWNVDRALTEPLTLNHGRRY